LLLSALSLEKLPVTTGSFFFVTTVKLVDIYRKNYLTAKGDASHPAKGKEKPEQKIVFFALRDDKQAEDEFICKAKHLLAQSYIKNRQVCLIRRSRILWL